MIVPRDPPHAGRRRSVRHAGATTGSRGKRHRDRSDRRRRNVGVRARAHRREHRRPDRRVNPGPRAGHGRAAGVHRRRRQQPAERAGRRRRRPGPWASSTSASTRSQPGQVFVVAGRRPDRRRAGGLVGGVSIGTRSSRYGRSLTMVDAGSRSPVACCSARRARDRATCCSVGAPAPPPRDAYPVPAPARPPRLPAARRTVARRVLLVDDVRLVPGTRRRRSRRSSRRRVSTCALEPSQRRDLHERYEIAAIPMILVADEEGVVRRAFVGATTRDRSLGRGRRAARPRRHAEPDIGAMAAPGVRDAGTRGPSRYRWRGRRVRTRGQHRRLPLSARSPDLDDRAVGLAGSCGSRRPCGPSRRRRCGRPRRRRSSRARAVPWRRRRGPGGGLEHASGPGLLVAQDALDLFVDDPCGLVGVVARVDEVLAEEHRRPASPTPSARCAPTCPTRAPSGGRAR